MFGRHTAVIEDDFRVYWAQAGDSPLIADVLAAVLAATDAFAEAAGRRPRILVAKMGRVMKTGAEWRVPQRPDDGGARCGAAHHPGHSHDGGGPPLGPVGAACGAPCSAGPLGAALVFSAPTYVGAK